MGGYTPPEAAEYVSPDKKNKLLINSRIIDSGIAQIMVDTINKHNRRGLNPIRMEDCRFSVSKEGGRLKNDTVITIEMPTPYPETSARQPTVSQDFRVVQNESFGVGSEPPLTPEQWDIIQQILQ